MEDFNITQNLFSNNSVFTKELFLRSLLILGLVSWTDVHKDNCSYNFHGSRLVAKNWNRTALSGWCQKP